MDSAAAPAIAKRARVGHTDRFGAGLSEEQNLRQALAEQVGG
jgi:hypothetical protein